MIEVFDTPDDQFDAAARRVATRIAAGPVHLLLAGGSTPRALYQRLAAMELPWANAHVWWGDERAVPPDHADSNVAMARAALLDRIAIPAAQVHRPPGELGADAAADAYEREARAALGRPRLALLGLGEDAHTASLFPDSPALDEATRWFVAADGPRGSARSPNVRRITATLALLNGCDERLVLATGAGKAAAVARALREPPSPAAPASLLGPAIWLLDRAAAEP